MKEGIKQDYGIAFRLLLLIIMNFLAKFIVLGILLGLPFTSNHAD